MRPKRFADRRPGSTGVDAARGPAGLIDVKASLRAGTTINVVGLRTLRALRRLTFVVAVSGLISCADEATFEGDARPVLEARCATASCHGVAPGQAWPDTEGLFLSIDAQGRLDDLPAAREAALARIVTTAPAILSSLVRVPSPTAYGGGPHAGGALFSGPDDPALQRLLRWIEAQPAGGEDVELTELQRRFGDTVLPVLVERCGRGGCHGPTDVAFTAFPARPDAATGQLAPRDIRSAYGPIRKHLDLWSDDPTRARLVRKALGPLAGGLAHRGGDGTFFPEAPADDPMDADGLRAIVEWARAERDALGVVDGQAPSGLLFVRGPAAPRSPYRIEPGPTGSDLFLSPWPPSASAADNLTAPLHPGRAAEVRDPAVSHDGRRVAFAMRLDGEATFELWEIELSSRLPRRRAPDAPGSLVQPAWAPDGRLVAVWDGHGELGADGDGVAPELVAIEEDDSITRLTFTPAPEVEPASLATGKTRGELAFATRRSGPDGPEALVFRMPLCHDADLHGEPEYHVHFGASIAPRAPHAARDLPDGRQIVIVLADPYADDDRGALSVLDRSLGPALSEAQRSESSLGGYLDPLRDLDPAPRYRDPAPLPDGRVVVAADDPSRPGEDALYVVDPDTFARQELLAVPGEALRDPAPVFVRPVEDDGHAEVIDEAEDSGWLVLRDVAVLEALYGRAEPTGARVLDERIVGVRLLAWSAAPAEGVRFHDDGGTTVGLSRRPPAGLLAEVDLFADRSAWLRIPARTPVLLTWLDADGMTLGYQLDRWYFAEGLETIPGGTNTRTYAHACSGCHGSLSGRPEEAAAPAPDAISAASVTLSTHEARDRRRPLDAAVMPRTAERVDFVTTLRPLLDARCLGAGCHAGEAPAAELRLDAARGDGRFPEAYTQLFARGLVDADTLRARRSALVAHLLEGDCPPGGLSDDELAVFVRWIETGAFHDVEARQ